jgi:DNA repair photolyase
MNKVSKQAVIDRGLDRIVRALFEPLLMEVKGRPWRILNWDAEQGLSLFVERGDHVILVEFESRDDEKPCYDRTKRFNVLARLLFHRDAPLDDPDRALVEHIIRVVRLREGDLPVAEAPQATRRAELRQVRVERLLMPEAPGQYYINPYAGCTIGCEFCYVAERSQLSRSLEGLPELAWGRYVDVKVNAAEILRTEAGSAEPGLVRMSPILTDPYQPAEGKYRVTRSCLEVLQEFNFTPVILTRAHRILEDLELLKSFPLAVVGFSIPTNRDDVRALFEPGADPVEARFEALQACHEAGLRTFGVIQPMLPMDADEMVEAMAPWVEAVRIDRMHQLERVHPMYAKAQLEAAADDLFFDETERRLRAGFAERSVPVDDLDDLVSLLGLR